MRARVRRHGVAAACLALLGLAGVTAGCGGEKTFTAEQFVDEVNAEGVELRLGEELVTDEDGKELYGVELDQVAQLPGDDDRDPNTGGSISVYDDTGGADDEMQNCLMAADLLCFQAANVVVILEGGGIEAQQLGVAIRRLSEQE